MRFGQNADCKAYLAIWEQWQQTDSEREEISPEVRSAINHIAACESCYSEISQIGYQLVLNTNKKELFRQMNAFLNTKKEKGVSPAALQNPAATNLLARKKGAWKIFQGFPEGADEWKKITLPRDVGYTIEQKLKTSPWVTLFIEHFGAKRLDKIARATLEFNLDLQNATSLISRQMVDILTSTMKNYKITVNNEAASLKQVTISTSEISANIQINAQKGRVDVSLPVSVIPNQRRPILMLVSEGGVFKEKPAAPIQSRFTAFFSGLNSGNYLLALDVIDRSGTAGETIIPKSHPPTLKSHLEENHRRLNNNKQPLD